MRLFHCSGLLMLGLLAGCQVTDAPRRSASSVPDATLPESSSANGRTLPIVVETFLSPMTPEDNIDSPAAWAAPDGSHWLLATAKATDKLLVYDGQSGRLLRQFGARGSAPGEFKRPNGVAVVDNYAFVVERDNHRVQMLRLPGFETALTFGAQDLIKPYGLWINQVGTGYEIYVTDAYMAGEDAQGEDILPPLTQLDRRVRRYAVQPQGDHWRAKALGHFGDSSPSGALRVVESIWGDAHHDRLLIAEEDESYANELKVYDLDGRFSGRTLGRDVFQAQAEGIALKRCGDTGWWLTTEQGKGRTVFHLFDRDSLRHVGAVTGSQVANTDGIWLHDVASPRFPEGVLYAVHDDQGVVALDWRDIARALALPACA